MPRYKLRTLLILLAIGPPMLAWAWPFVKNWMGQNDSVDQFRAPSSALVECYDPLTGRSDIDIEDLLTWRKASP
jgi:hypothetical protein